MDPPTHNEIFLCGTKSLSYPYPTYNDVFKDVAARPLSNQVFLEAVAHAINTSKTSVLILKDLTLGSIEDIFGEAFKLCLRSERHQPRHQIICGWKRIMVAEIFMWLRRQ